jgi:hypothetical protein
MSDKPGNPTSDYRHHDGTLGSSADRSAKLAVPDTFPASDPVATTPAVGVRAEAVAEMMDDSVLPDVPDPATVTARFPDHVTAKLAIEKLVRDVPMDRRCATLSEEGGAILLKATSSKSDLERVTEILRRGGGDLSP